jgi:hypothetical protein
MEPNTSCTDAKAAAAARKIAGRGSAAPSSRRKLARRPIAKTNSGSVSMAASQMLTDARAPLCTK